MRILICIIIIALIFIVGGGFVIWRLKWLRWERKKRKEIEKLNKGGRE